MSLFGCGIVTRPGFVGVRELQVASLGGHMHRAVLLEHADEPFAFAFHHLLFVVYEYTHTRLLEQRRGVESTQGAQFLWYAVKSHWGLRMVCREICPGALPEPYGTSE